MKLKVHFGSIDTKEVSWWRPLGEFYHLVKFLGRNYEWVSFDTDDKGDTTLLFSELMNYDPNYGVDCPVWTDLFPENASGCECGSKYTSFPDAHMFYCPKWKEWS
jgi:hypothetical protein